MAMSGARPGYIDIPPCQDGPACLSNRGKSDHIPIAPFVRSSLSAPAESIDSLSTRMQYSFRCNTKSTACDLPLWINFSRKSAGCSFRSDLVRWNFEAFNDILRGGFGTPSQAHLY